MAAESLYEKDEFADIEDKDFKDNVASMGTAEIKSLIGKIAIDQMELMEAKKQDQDLADKKAAAYEAGAQYRDGTKQNRLKQEFCKRVLGDRGAV